MGDTKQHLPQQVRAFISLTHKWPGEMQPHLTGGSRVCAHSVCVPLHYTKQLIADRCHSDQWERGTTLFFSLLTSALNSLFCTAITNHSVLCSSRLYIYIFFFLHIFLFYFFQSTFYALTSDARSSVMTSVGPLVRWHNSSVKANFTGLYGNNVPKKKIKSGPWSGLLGVKAP